MHRIIGVLALAVAFGACATTSSGGGSSNRITAEELAQAQAPTAYDAIRQLRPSFLRERNSTRGVPVQVYVDGMHMGGVGVLHRISVTEIVEIRRMDPNTATIQFGTNHMNGAILIKTRRG